MKIKPCPKCGCCEYLATAHVTQTWLINQDGDFVESKPSVTKFCTLLTLMTSLPVRIVGKKSLAI